MIYSFSINSVRNIVPVVMLSLIFWSGLSQAEVIITGDRVGIDTDTPQATLDVNGDIAVNGSIVINSEGQWLGDLESIRGDSGNSGASGEKGDTGDKGVTGLDGGTGAEGGQGDAAEQGEQGGTGSVGPQGDTGPMGLEGDPSVLNGERGDQGATGADGPRGFSGPTGPRGITGLAGSRGVTGTDGVKGLKGGGGIQLAATTNKGSIGATGVRGDQGPVGPVGNAFANLVQFRSGTDLQHGSVITPIEGYNRDDCLVLISGPDFDYENTETDSLLVKSMNTDNDGTAGYLMICGHDSL